MYLAFCSPPVALQRWIPRADRGDEQAQTEQGKDSFTGALFMSTLRTAYIFKPLVAVKLIDRCLSVGRSSQRTERSGVRCSCLAGTSSSWSSASGTSLDPERAPTSTNSGPTSLGWVPEPGFILSLALEAVIANDLWAESARACSTKRNQLLHQEIQTFVKLKKLTWR